MSLLFTFPTFQDLLNLFDPCPKSFSRIRVKTERHFTDLAATRLLTVRCPHFTDTSASLVFDYYRDTFSSWYG